MTSLLKKKRCRPGLLGIEKLGIIYAVATALTALLFRNEMPELPQMLATRSAFLAGIAVFAAVYRRKACHLTFFLRILLQMAMLAVWYPETYLFCRLFGNYDHVFAMVDQHIFGCQPALLFSEKLGAPVWCELFNLGYFSYYPMIAFLVIWTFMRRYILFEKTTFIVMCSFFIFYAVFMFLPVAGPQFYYQAIGLDAVRAGTFPQIGVYFQNHFDMIDPPTGGALFQWLVEAAQKSGERPTAAFPSSHVGISSIIMILAWKADKHRRIFLGLLPFYTLLCFSTVYIHAHYAIDAIAGLLVAYPIYRISHAIYYTRTFHRPRGYHS